MNNLSHFSRQNTVRQPLKNFVFFVLGFLFLSHFSVAQAQSFATCEQPNLLIVLDKSGSMLGKISGKTKWSIASSAITTISNTYKKKMRFGLITFSSVATKDYGIDLCIYDDLYTFQGKDCAGWLQYEVSQITPKNGDPTNIKDAFEKAAAHLTTIKTSDSVPNRKTSIMFISDGEDTVSTTDDYGNPLPSGTKYCPEKLVTDLKNAGIKTYVIGFGDGIDGGCLNKMAIAGGTSKSGTNQYYQANNSTELNTAMADIANNTTSEECNNLDDDCDGVIDNGLSKACTTTCGTGTSVCSAGKWGKCSSGDPEPEICDNKDNDCNGQIDNGLSRTCSTACGSGTETCVAGNWVNCSAKQPVTEICDGLDNDCDGQIDENWTLGTSCSVGTGQCKASGVYRCKANGTGRECSVQAGTPTTELCDGLDNDCDGAIDEDFADKGTTCTVGVGECQNTGVKVCSTGGQTTECSVQAKAATVEVCDSKDNDCDGAIDEDFPQVTNKQACTVGKGECAKTGTYICRADKQGFECNVQAGTPSTEVCDGKDNDCNGQIDETFTQLGQVCSVGTGACKSDAKWTCKSDKTGVYCPTQAQTASAEICDGVDNDCDGQIDNVQGTTNSIQQACYSGASATKNQGLCKEGTQTCSNGQWGSCVNQVLPSVEVCDGKDNDCDGAIDEDFPEVANGVKTACSVGIGSCKVSSTWQCKADATGVECPVQAKQPTVEVCDGIDNDCDGQIDNIASSNKPLEQICYTGTPNTRKIGQCSDGTQVCQNAKWSDCQNQVLPTTELCDGKDNDCDGAIDEDFPQKDTACSDGVGACQKSAKWTCSSDGSKLECPATAGTPTAETCDGKDNDCDGKIDNQPNSSDVLKRECYNGSNNTAGVGVCQKGTQTCSNSQWGSCVGEVVPSQEICDGKDNDCNGQIDEGFATLGKECVVGVGECKVTSKYTCLGDGSGVECAVAPRKPAQEICDGKDNNCDGTIDENLSKPCSNDCGTGVQLCQNGVWDTCTAPTPTTEVCDGKDNDCDGLVDNGLKRECSSICGKGEETCVQGNWTFCTAPQPSQEICDGKDNDCNGQIDDLPAKQCSGACGSGTAECKNGQWAGCSGPQPTVETCDNLDNDCNGKIDDNVERTCQTACGTGKEVCEAGQWKTCTAPQPQVEWCDGKDNDCDGKIDNQAKCSNGSVCFDGACRETCLGECGGGKTCESKKCKQDDGSEIDCSLCMGDPCSNVQCKQGNICVGGQCVELCKTITCPGGEICKAGKCIEDNCYSKGCPSNETCVNGVCSANPCHGITCPSGEFCRQGTCISSCANVTCPADQICKDGSCVQNICDKVRCKQNYYCGPQGVCVEDKCNGITCPQGKTCVDGSCQHNPCWNIRCAKGEKCVNEQCVHDPNPPQEEVVDVENIHETSKEKVADSQEKVTVADGGENNVYPDKTVTNPLPDSQTTNPKDKDPQGDGKSTGTGDKADAPVGCGCDVSKNNAPLGTLLFFLLIFFPLALRRKK